jgi:hypothetical protein
MVAMVSKHRERAYRGGQCQHWLKGEEPEAPGDAEGQGGVQIKSQAAVRPPSFNIRLVSNLQPEFFDGSYR